MKSAPAAIKSMWSVLTLRFVLTMAPTQGAEYPFARPLGKRRCPALFGDGDFIDLIQKDDAHLFRLVHRFGGNLFHIDQFIAFFLDENAPGLFWPLPAVFSSVWHETAENLPQIDAHFVHSSQHSALLGVSSTSISSNSGRGRRWPAGGGYNGGGAYFPRRRSTIPPAPLNPWHSPASSTG